MSKQINISISPELRAQVDAEKQRTGASVAEIIRRALAMYLNSRESGRRTK